MCFHRPLGGVLNQVLVKCNKARKTASWSTMTVVEVRIWPTWEQSFSNTLFWCGHLNQRKSKTDAGLWQNYKNQDQNKTATLDWDHECIFFTLQVKGFEDVSLLSEWVYYTWPVSHQLISNREKGRHWTDDDDRALTTDRQGKLKMKPLLQWGGKPLMNYTVGHYSCYISS